MLQNLMSMIDDMVSSSDLMSVGPKHTPMLAVGIRFLVLFWETLEKKKQTKRL